MSNKHTHGENVRLTDAVEVTIRPATASDGRALERLAQLDSSRLPDDPMLIAEVDRAPQAAYSLLEQRAIANPFRRTAELVELLEMHARHVDGTRRNLRHGGRRSAAPQPPGFGSTLLPRLGGGAA